MTYASRRGVALIELIVTMGIVMTLLGVGCRLYSLMLANDSHEARREELELRVRCLAERVRSDVRQARSVGATSTTLSVDNGRIAYRMTDGKGVRRTQGRRNVLYADVAARFAARDGGIEFHLTAADRMRKRRIAIDESGFVVPRN